MRINRIQRSKQSKRFTFTRCLCKSSSTDERNNSDKQYHNEFQRPGVSNHRPRLQNSMIEMKSIDSARTQFWHPCECCPGVPKNRALHTAQPSCPEREALVFRLSRHGLVPFGITL